MVKQLEKLDQTCEVSMCLTKGIAVANTTRIKKPTFSHRIASNKRTLGNDNPSTKDPTCVIQ